MRSRASGCTGGEGSCSVCCALAVGAAAAFAVPFYAEIGGWWWALALVALYVAGLFGVLQLLLWPLAIFELDRPLTDVARDVARRAACGARPPGAPSRSCCSRSTSSASSAGLVPFLTLTVAYSFLAAAHFALPRPNQEAQPHGQRDASST